MKIITIEAAAGIQLNNWINAMVDYLQRLNDISYDDLWQKAENRQKKILKNICYEY
ncbi:MULTISPECIES: hypothetical protein [Bacteroidota]|uniref:Uncharacterized protein n=1 Tax=Sphingobacterium multivorum TaxID=28454 RepID=A0A653ZLC9_SPHMU|nr:MULTISPECIES: hypothetical protein [Bacteroidota]VXC56112.1 hypothetical protein SPHINGO8BC_140228 [Sphingobacterium multivorum]